MRVLIVVAHPDDEVLGAGGLISRLSSEGLFIRTCILSGDVDVRKNRPDLAHLHQDIRRAHEVLGAGEEPILGCFPNIAFNTVPHVQMVQFIEKALVETRADYVFTHHPQDVNDDHQQTSKACQAAVRLFQRGEQVPRLAGFYFIEILSATDWTFQHNGGFQPNAFVALGEAHLKRKIEALGMYRGVMRSFPHPRSQEILTGLAAYRGGQAGMPYAEAFQTVFQDLGRHFLP